MCGHAVNRVIYLFDTPPGLACRRRHFLCCLYRHHGAGDLSGTAARIAAQSNSSP